MKPLSLLPFVRPYCTSAALYSPVQSGCIRAPVRCIRRTSLRERVVRGCACVRDMSVYAWLTALYIPCYTSAHICAPIYRAVMFFASCMVAYSQKSRQKKLEKSPASYPERKAHAIKIGILSFPSPGPVYFSWIFSGLNSRIYFPASYPHFVFSASHGHALYTTADSPSHWILPSSESGDLTKACQ